MTTGDATANVVPAGDDGSDASDVGSAQRRSMQVAEHRDPVALLEQWLRGIRIAHVGHTRAATVFARRGRILGIGATIVSAVVGTTLFSSLGTSADVRLITFAAIMSVAAVILTALQTFLNYGELVSAHRAAAGAYGSLRRRAEQLVVFEDPAKLREPMSQIADTWTKLDQDSPDLPQGIYEYASKWVATRERFARPGPG